MTALRMNLLKTIWKTFYHYWMKLAHAMGWVNTRILLFLFFYLLLGPMALIARAFGKNFYDDNPKGSPSYWHLRPEPAFSKESCRRQF